MENQIVKRILLLLFFCALIINSECEAENITNCLRSVNVHAVIIQKTLQLNAVCEFLDPSKLGSATQSYNITEDHTVKISGCSISQNQTISPLLDSEKEQFDIECKAHGAYKIHQVYKLLNLEVENVLKNLTNERYVLDFLRYYLGSKIADMDNLLRKNGNRTLSFEVECTIKDLSCKKSVSTSTVSSYFTTITITVFLLSIIIVLALFHQKLKIFGKNSSNAFTNFTYNNQA